MTAVGTNDPNPIEPTDWQRAHRELVRIAKARASLDWEEGRWLVRAFRAGAHVALGFGHFTEYAERYLGYKPRWTEEKLRVAEALEALPLLGEALRTASLGWSAVREVTRVATPETERDWLRAVQGRTVRDIERLVSGRKPGDGPRDPADPRLIKHTLRFDVTAETLAAFREATVKLRRDAGQRLDDDALLLLMARSILRGPSDEGRASYQIAMTVCDECRKGSMQGNGASIQVDADVVAMAECDAQRVSVGETDVGAVRRERTHVGTTRDEGPAPDGETHLGADRRRRTHVGTARQAGGETLRRAKQDIPPATRRVVRRRDEHCVVPGCTHAVYVDIHHLVPRQENGSRDADNLILVCAAHHRAIHRGTLLVQGTASAGLLFLHADGSPYGSVVCPKAADLAARTFQALCGMGFRPSEARRAVDRIRRESGESLSIEQWIRRALAVLTETLVAA